jgi:ribosome-associated protein
VEALEIRQGLVIPAADLTVSFSRAAGPGGQNVNKVATRATLRFALSSTTALPDRVKERLRELARTRLSRRGDLLLSSQRHREQARNIEDCREKLRELVKRALVRPRPRRPTGPTSGSVERRLAAKSRRGQAKRERAKRPGAEEA